MVRPGMRRKEERERTDYQIKHGTLANRKDVTEKEWHDFFYSIDQHIFSKFVLFFVFFCFFVLFCFVNFSYFFLK